MSIEQDRPLNLVSGWNIIGFTCNEPIDVVDAFLPIVDKVIIAKDNNGGAYIPEFGFNGIGVFEYGYGYQLKLTDAITDFQFCPFLVPLIEGCMDETAFNYNLSANLDDGSCYPFVYGCLDNLYIEYNDFANTDDGSCETLIVWGCIDESALNFNEEANADDGSCMYPIGGIEFQLNYGWNLVGFTGCEITPIEEAFQNALGNGSSLEETFEIIKDLRGRMWHSELGENSSLTHLTPGEGYMMYVKDEGYGTTLSFSEEYCNDITYQLNLGWNMIGYTGDEVSDVVSSINSSLVSGSDIYSTFELIEDVTGYFWNEFFAALQTFNPGEAYLMYVKVEGDGTTLSFTDNSTQVFANNPGVGFTLPATDNNMSVIFPIGSLSGFAGGQLIAYNEGVPVSEPVIISDNGSAGVGVIGTDYFCGYGDCDFLPSSGQEISFAILMEDETTVIAEINPPIAYAANSVINTYNDLSFSIDGEQVVFGCDDFSYTEYSPDANLNDGSCATVAIFGCMDANACNFNNAANSDDGSCVTPSGCESCTGETDGSGSVLANDDDDDGFCNADEILGCTDPYAFKDNPEATDDDWYCYPIIMGCLDSIACNFNPEANMADGSCTYDEEGYDCNGNPLLNCFYPPDPEFVSWLQENTPGVINGECLDFDAAGEVNTYLDISSSNIINLDGLQYFTNLIGLEIYDNGALTSLPDLSGLTNLIGLYIYMNDVLTSFPGLSSLTNLSELYIENNDALTSLPDLSGLTNLIGLEIYGNDALTSLPDLSGLTNLNLVLIYDNDALTSLPDLSGLTNLSLVQIYDNDSLTVFLTSQVSRI